MHAVKVQRTKWRPPYLQLTWRVQRCVQWLQVMGQLQALVHALLRSLEILIRKGCTCCLPSFKCHCAANLQTH